MHCTDDVTDNHMIAPRPTDAANVYEAPPTNETAEAPAQPPVNILTPLPPIADLLQHL